MKSTITVGALALALLASGCASIIGGTTQKVTVNSNVDGADVYLNDQPLGKTPLVATIDRGQEGVLSVRKDGHTPYQIALNKKITSVFWLNIFIGGLFGSSTDYSTGAMYEYEPATYFASIRPAGGDQSASRKWERKESLRAYVLLNSEALVADFAAGKGEHAELLVSALKVAPADRDEAFARWRKTYQASETANAFAESLVSELPQD